MAQSKYDDYDFPTTSPEPQSGHPGHTNPEQDAAVHQLRAELEQLGYADRLDTLTLLRFLRARKFDIQAAKTMYVYGFCVTGWMDGWWLIDAGSSTLKSGGKSLAPMNSSATSITSRSPRFLSTTLSTITRRTRCVVSGTRLLEVK